MEIRIVNHVTNAQAAGAPPSPIVGHIHVHLGGKIKVWMNAIRSKKGFIFLAFPSLKIKGEWITCLEWDDKDMAREISAALKDEVKKIFEKSPDWAGGL